MSLVSPHAKPMPLAVRIALVVVPSAALLVPAAALSIFALMLGCAAPDGLHIVDGTVLAWACGEQGNGALGFLVLGGPIAALLAGTAHAVLTDRLRGLLAAVPVAAAFAAGPAVLIMYLPESVA